MSAPKLIRLWISTRSSGKLLSGIHDKQRVKELYEKTGVYIGEEDAKEFDKCLKKFSLYSKESYRGVFKNDNFYMELMKYGKATNTRHYSCSKNYDLAKCFGDKVVIVFPEHSIMYDISKYSKEQEVVLYKNQSFVVDKIKLENGVSKIYLKTV